METIGIILLAIIAYYLWKIYKQREDEKKIIAEEKFDVELEQNKREEFKDYPHLLGNVSYTWLELFGRVYIEKNFPHLKIAWLLYLGGTTKIENPQGAIIFDTLWDLTEELLEHLEKYHEGNKYEFEIAVDAYWQINAERVGEIIEKDPMTDGELFKETPFTDIEKIVTWFPKKEGHPKEEISFRDKKTGLFPKKSKGSKIIENKLKELGL
ncbi:MAG: hypothetical protein HOC36_02880 [Candidatus Magasanikbacteria bacterium]|jgi:hypothetical protein|nr:hypothetical protein [Candidatus Magasanikbacteria bacterium]MBT4547266.1 hypothetical protein [Candidatus Magasanikbacteria bacterium]